MEQSKSSVQTSPIKVKLKAPAFLHMETFVVMHIPIELEVGSDDIELEFAIAEWEEQRKQKFPNPISRMIYLN